MQKISVPAGLWYENEEKELTFPDRWEVTDLNSPGFDKPGLSSDQIKEKINQPVEGPSLVELARGKNQAVIVFDDMTRPTRVKEIAPHVLECLHEAGLKENQIRFIWGLGSHGTYDMINTRKKLGAEIVEKYRIYNHDPFQHTKRVGRTPTGVELWFNQEFLSCDLKIAIGCITPHPQVGFGGGAKLILPGVAGIETIVQFHNQLHTNPTSGGLGNYQNNVLRPECEAAAELVGLNFVVNVLVNRRAEITDLYAGPSRAVLEAGIEEAVHHYAIPSSAGYDLAVCNTYAKASESVIALILGLRIVKRGEGTAVLISDAPEGQVPHYVFRSWGSDYGGRHYTHRDPGFIPRLLKKLIVMAPHPDRTSLDMMCHNDDAVFVKNWPQVLEILEKDYPAEAKVAVIQDGTMQYMQAEGE